jgi:hypothetical protein
MSWDNTTLFTDDTDADCEFRAEVREWVTANCPASLRHRPGPHRAAGAETLASQACRARLDCAALAGLSGFGLPMPRSNDASPKRWRPIRSPGKSRRRDKFFVSGEIDIVYHQFMWRSEPIHGQYRYSGQGTEIQPFPAVGEETICVSQ